MSAGAELLFPWERFWVPLGEKPAVSDGYFVEPAVGVPRLLAAASNGVSLDSLRERSCLILLGDVGMGKSTVVADYAQRLQRALTGQNHAVVFRDLKRVHESQIIKHIFGDPSVEDWIRGKCDLTLFIDSLDECWRRVELLESLLVGELESLDLKSKPSFFLRLACRSAEWHGHVGDALERLFPRKDQNEKQIFVLAPLSKKNIHQAAESVGQSGQKLVAAIAQKRAKALANHPVTFRMLLDIFREGGDLPDTRVKLYEQGCLHLCEDRHTRFPERSLRKTTRTKRMVTAARIAAIGVLTNRLLVNGDSERCSDRTDVLNVVDVFGSSSEQADSSSFEIQETCTREALQTALFSERTEDVQAWRHQSYAEFLAAWYLRQKKLRLPELIRFLTDNSDGVARVVPQLEETTCWLAEMEPALFESLASDNAETFIRCGAAQWNDSQRAKLVTEYLNAVGTHAALQLDYQLRGQFAWLDHSNLGKQIGSVISDSSANELVREMAIDIAGACKCRSVAETLVSVFLNPADTFRARKHAGEALEQICDDGIRDLIKQKATVASLDEETDDIRGYYLNMLWPTHLTLAEVLSLLSTPNQQNYFGHYKIFIGHRFLESLKLDDIALVLDWILDRKISFDRLAPFGHFAPRVFALGLKNLDDAKVRDAVIRIILADDESLYDVFRDLPEKHAIDPFVRRDFWEAVADGPVDLQRLVIYGNLHATGLLNRDDLSWFAEKVRLAGDERVRSRWRELMFSVFDPEDSAAIAVVSELARSDSQVTEGLSNRTSCPLLPDKDNWIKRNYLPQLTEKKREALQKSTESFLDVLEQSLRHFEGGKVDAFWHVAELLQRDPTDVHDMSWTIKVAEGAAWKFLGAEYRQRILNLIPVYIDKQEVKELEVWNAENRRPYDALLSLLTLLFDEARDLVIRLPNSCWKKWGSVLVRYCRRFNGNHDEATEFFFRICMERAPESTTAAFERFFSEQINSDHERSLIWRLDAIWSDRIESIFVRMLGQSTLKASAAQDVLNLLYRHNPPIVRVWCESTIENRQSEISVTTQVPVAGALLLTGFTEEWGERTLDLFEADVPLGKAIALRLLHTAGQPRGWILKLSAAQHARLWHWLDLNFPGNPYNGHGGGALVVTDTHEMWDFRRVLFDGLIQRNTPEACSAMAELMTLRPEAFWLGDVLAGMRKATRQFRWLSSSPKVMMEAVCSDDRSLIRTARDLQLLILESLRRFETTLHESPPSLELWNAVGTKKTIWDPKNENMVSDCLKRHLDQDLIRRGIISSREVQIRRKFGDDAAQLVDLLVAAVPFDEDGNPGEPVSIVLEVKCSWNDGIFEDMKRQLRARYLSGDSFDFGIYVVIYFQCTAWNLEGDGRQKSGASGHAIEDVARRLASQAKLASSDGKVIEPVVIDARISVS